MPPSPWRKRAARRSVFRAPLVEPLENRHLMAVDWRNPVDSVDVNADGNVVPLDALLIINRLNSGGSAQLPLQYPAGDPYYDVTGDQFVSPRDALTVINHLNVVGSGVRVLRDGPKLANELDLTVTLGHTGGSRIYRLELQPQFNRSDTLTALEDTLAVYLVDPGLPSSTLLDRGSSGTPLFSLTGDLADYVPGMVKWDGRVLELDLSSITTLDTGLLRVQLLQSDGDSGSTVRVRPLTNKVNDAVDPAPQFPERNVASVAGPALNITDLAVRNDLSLTLNNVRFTQSDGTYEVDLRLSSDGTSVGRHVAVAFPNLPSGVVLQNASGTTPTGAPYVNLEPLLPSGGLPINGMSEPVRLKFSVSNNTAFALRPQMFGDSNRAPVLQSISPVSVLPGGVARIPLVANDSDGDRLTFSIRSQQMLPTMRLSSANELVIRPLTGEEGTYSFEIIASDGIAQTSTPVALSVPIDPLTSTRVSGQILGTTGQPLVGMPVSIGNIHGLTATDGTFTLDLGAGLPVSDTIKVRGENYPGPAEYPFIAEKLRLLFERDMLIGANNVLPRAIYLPELDIANGQTINPVQDTLVSTVAIPGAAVFVAAGTLMNQQGTPFSGVLSITEVPVSLTPAALPRTLLPDLVVTIQPGEMVFASPAPLTLPNRSGYQPGTVLDLWSINPVTGDFDDVGDSRVSADGSIIETVSGGIRNSSWHFVAPPPPKPKPPGNPRNHNPACDECPAKGPTNGKGDDGGGSEGGGGGGGGGGGSGGGRGGGGSHGGGNYGNHSSIAPMAPPPVETDLPVPSLPALYPPPKNLSGTTPTIIEHHSGGVLGENNSGGYISVGVFRSTALVYDSLRADGRPIVHFGYTDAPANSDSLLAASISVSRGTLTFDHPGLPAGTLGLQGGQHLWSIPLDGGEIDAALQLDLRNRPSGVYNYTLSTGLLRPTDGLLVGSSVEQTNSLLHVNTIESPFGAGWGLSGWQQIVENPDGSALLIDGDGSEVLFGRPATSSSQFVSPPGDFSKLEKLAGLFRRTTKEQTVFSFNSRHQLESVADSSGNRTTYNYDSAGNLSMITDPVGLSTSFTWSNDKVASFTEPGGQTTQLFYDASGNLTEVRDPHGASQFYHYDHAHHLTQKVDKSGQAEHLNYDFAGRLTQSIAADGSVRRFHSPQVDGLRPPQATLNTTDPPTADPVGPALASVADAHGNVQSILLDAAGQAISAQDSVGRHPQVSRDEKNLIAREIDARGHVTFYEYDSHGNLTKIRDEVSSGNVLGAITVAGQIFDYSFTARRGERLFYDALSSHAGDIRVTLTAPSGAALFQATDADGDRGVFDLAETGTYNVRVQGNGTQVGNYDFRIYVSPNNISRLALDTTIEGSIDVPGERDVFQFTAEIGQRIFFDRMTGTGGDLRYSVLGPHGEVLSSFASAGDSAIVIDIPGEYQVHFIGNGDNTGTYRFRANTAATTVRQLSKNTPTTASIIEAGEQQIYRFHGDIGDQLYIDSLGGVGGDVRYSFLSPTGEYLATFSARGNTGPFFLDEMGEYQIIVLGNGDAVGTFDFNLVTSVTNARQLSLNTVTQTTIAKPGDREFFSFDGTVGQRIFVDVQGITGGDLRYGVVDPIGERLIEFTAGDNSFVVDRNGTYQIQLFGNADQTGNFTFAAYSSQESVVPLVVDTPTSGNIAQPGNRIVYKVNAVAGERFYFDALQFSGGDLRYQVFSPIGELLTSFQSFNNDASWVANLSGEYNIVTLGNGDNTGTFQFQLVTPTDQTIPLTLGTIQDGSIDEPGERDIYTFTGTVGQQIYFDALLEEAGDLRLNLISPTGEYLSTFAPRNSDVGPITLIESGVYQLQILGNGQTTGSYHFQVLDGSTQIINLSAPTGVNLLPRQTSAHRINGVAGQRLNFDIQVPGTGSWALRTESGNLLASAGMNTDFIVAIPDNGPYTLYLSSTSNSATSVNFVVTDISDSTVVPTPEALTSGTITAGEVDTYLFSINAGTLLTFDHQGPSITSLRATLTGPGSEQVFFSDDMGDRIVVAPRSGIYTLTVQGDNASSTGAYAFRMVNQKNSTLVAGGQSIAGNIQVGERDFYRFSADVGDRIIFDSSTTADLRYAVYTPSGQEIIGNADLRLDSSRLTLRETGDYQIVVMGGNAATGAYDFKIIESSVHRTDSNFDTLITGDIAVPGEIEIYTFSAVAGQRAIFNPQSSADLRYQFVSPTGVITFGDMRFDSDGFLFGETGIYQLQVFSISAALGTFSFTLGSPSLTETATTLNQPIVGTLAEPGEVDIYTFAGATGQRILFDTNGVVGVVGYYLLDPTGSVIIPGGNAIFDSQAFQLERTGTYKIVLANARDFTGSYNFTLRTADTVVQSAQFNQRIAGSIAQPGEVDIYTFDVTAGQRVAFNREISTPVRYHLISPSGVYAIHNAGAGFDSSGLRLEETGRYQLVLFGHNAETGPYDFQLHASATTTNSSALNTPIIGSLDTPGELDIYTLFGQAGQRVTFASNLTLPDPVRLHLISPTGNYVLSNVDSRFGGNGFQLEETGLYTVAVFEINDGVGPYEFQFRSATISTFETALNAPLVGEIATPGEVDVYRFSAAAGQRILIDAATNTGGNLRYDLVSPSGDFVRSGVDARADSGVFALDESGEWQLVVNGQSTNIGAYNLRLIDLSQAQFLPLDVSFAVPTVPAFSARAFAFAGRAGEHLYFDNQSFTGSGSWQLLGEFGQSLASSSIGNDFEITLPDSATYTLLISSTSAVPLQSTFRAVSSSVPVMPLAFDTITSGSIDKPGQSIRYLFNGGAGQRLWFDSLNVASSGVSVRLITPSGALNVQFPHTNNMLLHLKESGQYRLEFDGDATSVGMFAFRLLNLETSPTAIPATVIAGSLEPAAGSIAFSLDGQKGQRFRFDDAGTMPSTGTWSLYSPAGSLMATQSLGTDFNATLPTTGRYGLVLSGSAATAISYQFRIDPISDTPVTASGFGTVHRGTASGTPQLFNYSGSAGTKVYLDALEANSSAAMQLIDSANNVLITTNGSDTGPITLPQSGNYAVRVTGTGPFGFRLVDEAGMIRATTNVLINGILDQPFETDVYSIAGVAGQRLYVDMAGDTVGGDLQIAMVSPSGTTLFDKATNLGVGIVTLPESGTYILSVGRQSTTGNYGIRLLNINDTRLMNLGDSVSDAVSRGVEADVYRLNVTAGQPISIVGVNATTGSRLTVISPSNELLSDRVLAAGAAILPTFTGELVLVVDANVPIGDAYQLSVINADVEPQFIALSSSKPSANGGDRRLGYDSKFSQPISEVDELGRQMQYTVDINTGNRLSERIVIGTVGGTDDLVSSYTYTSRGQIETIIDPLGRLTRYVYDAHGRPTTIVMAEGTSEEASVAYEYDSVGNVSAYFDELGRRTDYLYNPRHQIVSVTEPDPDGAGPEPAPHRTYTYDVIGNLLEDVDARGNVTKYEYDALYRLTRSVDAAGEDTAYRYDDRGNLVEWVDRLGRTTTYMYDARNRLLQEIDPMGKATAYEYDLDDHLIRMVDAVGSVTEYSFDARGRSTSTIDAMGQRETWQYNAADEIVAIKDANGRSTRYVYDDAGRHISTTDAAGGVFTYTYDKAGNITTAQDELNRATKYAYDARNRVISSIDPLNGTQATTYDDVGNILTHTDQLGRVTSFSYDALDRTRQVTDALSGTMQYRYDPQGNVVESQDQLGRTIGYAYDSLNRLQRTTDALNQSTHFQYDAEGNVVSLVDKLNRTTRFAYDGLNRNIRTTDAIGGIGTSQYDAVGNLVTMTDKLGRTTQFTYDPLRRLSSVTDPLGHVWKTQYDAVGNTLSKIDPLGRTTRYEYDALNRLTTTVDPVGSVARMTYDAVGNMLVSTDELGRATTHVYDALNRLTRMTDAIGGQRNYSYDSVGNRISTEDELGRDTFFTYDVLNRLRKRTDALGGEVEYQYDAVGNLVAFEDELNRLTRFNYDALNRRTSSTNALNGVTAWSYDAVGNVVSATDELNRVARIEYDALDREVKSIDKANQFTLTSYDAVGNVLSITDELNRTVRFTYDALDRTLGIRSPLGNAAQYAYDAVGNLIKSTDALEQESRFTYDSLNRRVSVTDPLNGQQIFAYDAVGNLIRHTDELQRTTNYSYDPLDRLSNQKSPLGHVTNYTYDAVDNRLSETDPLGHSTSSGYDALNRRISSTDATGATTLFTYDSAHNVKQVVDSLGNTTSYAYDALNRLTAETNQFNASRLMEYDAAHNRTAIVDRNGRRRTFEYDALDQLTQERWLSSTGVPLKSIISTYDVASQLVARSDDVSSYAFGYDVDGRVASVTNGGTGGVPTVDQTYTYNAVNRLVGYTDAIAGVPAGTNTYLRDALDRVIRVSQVGAEVAPKRVDIAYDAASQMKAISRFSELSGTVPVAGSTYGFDQDGRLTELVHAKGNLPLAQYAWSFDEADRLKQVTMQDGVTNYNYDARNQLLSADHSGQADEAYTYDLMGNRTNPGYQSGGDNRLMSDGIYNYEYDAEGNRTRRTHVVTGVTTEYAWDYRNRLVSVTDKDANGVTTAVSSYTYDVFDRRIGKSVDADASGPSAPKIERYVYDGDNISLQFDGAGTLTHRYLHGPMVDQVLADENANGEVLWALSDHQGTVRDLTDDSGEVVNHLSYDSFGNLTAETNAAVDFLFGYTGRERDAESGLHYYRARYYDPSVGRFLTEDPLSFAAGDANLYRYVGNAATMHTDPTGLSPFMLDVEVIDILPVSDNPIPSPDAVQGLKADIPQMDLTNDPTPIGELMPGLKEGQAREDVIPPLEGHLQDFSPTNLKPITDPPKVAPISPLPGHATAENRRNPPGTHPPGDSKKKDPTPPDQKPPKDDRGKCPPKDDKDKDPEKDKDKDKEKDPPKKRPQVTPPVPPLITQKPDPRKAECERLCRVRDVLQELLKDESTHGTQYTARKWSNTWGTKKMGKDFDNGSIPGRNNIDIDMDWLADLLSVTVDPKHVDAWYVAAKSFHDFQTQVNFSPVWALSFGKFNAPRHIPYEDLKEVAMLNNFRQGMTTFRQQLDDLRPLNRRIAELEKALGIDCDKKGTKK